MFGWWRRHRREKLLETPFPAAWRTIIEQNVAYTRWLSEAEKKHLEELVQVFVAEKTFEGCGGLELDDEIRVTIAANACILLLGLEHDLFADVDTILVYPSTLRPPKRTQRLGGAQLGVVADSPLILGQAQIRGPVVLVWDAVSRNSRHPELGHNVVFHEFAHKLDMLDNEIDGTPPLRGSEQYAGWSKACGEVYFEMKQKVARGEPTFLDAYGATNEGEFFAVATEAFFESPRELKEHHPRLYDVLSEYYRQDPETRVHDLDSGSGQQEIG